MFERTYRFTVLRRPSPHGATAVGKGKAAGAAMNVKSQRTRQSVDETCWRCGSTGDDGNLERRPGWCSSCGFFFDLYGMQLFEPWLTCPVHSDLRSLCPHPAAGVHS